MPLHRALPFVAAALFSLPGCGPEVSDGDDGAAEGTGSEGGSGSAGEDPEPSEPNVMPPGVVISAPGWLPNNMQSLADYDGDGRPEAVFIRRPPPHQSGTRYEYAELNADDTGFELSEGLADAELGDRIYGGNVDHENQADAVLVSDDLPGGGSGMRPFFDGIFMGDPFHINGEFIGGPVDLDGDGLVELAWDVGTELRLYEADGAGSFEVLSTIPAPPCPSSSVRFEDLDADGDLDAVVVASCEGQLTFWTTRRSAAGEWESLHEVQTTTDPTTFCFADIDLDHVPDLVLAAVADDTEALHVHTGLGDGDFAAEPLTFEGAVDGSRKLMWTVCDDFDGDGDDEVASPPEGLGLATDADLVLLSLVGDELVTSDVEGPGLIIGTGDLNADGCADLVGLNDSETVARISDCR